jgi:hypothetical protein
MVQVIIILVENLWIVRIMYIFMEEMEVMYLMKVEQEVMVLMEMEEMGVYVMV